MAHRRISLVARRAAQQAHLAQQPRGLEPQNDQHPGAGAGGATVAIIIIVVIVVGGAIVIGLICCLYRCQSWQSTSTDSGAPGGASGLGGTVEAPGPRQHTHTSTQSPEVANDPGGTTKAQRGPVTTRNSSRQNIPLTDVVPPSEVEEREDEEATSKGVHDRNTAVESGPSKTLKVQTASEVENRNVTAPHPNREERSAWLRDSILAGSSKPWQPINGQWRDDESMHSSHYGHNYGC